MIFRSQEHGFGALHTTYRVLFTVTSNQRSSVQRGKAIDDTGAFSGDKNG